MVSAPGTAALAICQSLSFNHSTSSDQQSLFTICNVSMSEDRNEFWEIREHFSLRITTYIRVLCRNLIGPMIT